MSSYREYRPAPQLRTYVECYWTSSAAADAAGHRVLPDGCIDFLWLMDGSGARGKVVGTMTRAIVFEPKRELRAAAIRFRPGGAAPFLHYPACAITDDEVELDEQRLGDALSASGCDRGRIRLLEAFLLARLSGVRPLDVRIGGATEMLQREGTVFEAAELVGVSRQYLNRLFLREVGVGPKQFSRVMRLERLRRLRAADRDEAWTALAAGYCDQAHMIRECRALAGVTPSGLR